MQLPIDWRTAPIREKCLDETPTLAPWSIFGEHPDGTVDIATSEGDVFTHVPRAEAEQIVAVRQDFLAFIHELLGPKPH